MRFGAWARNVTMTCEWMWHVLQANTAVYYHANMFYFKTKLGQLEPMQFKTNLVCLEGVWNTWSIYQCSQFWDGRDLPLANELIST